MRNCFQSLLQVIHDWIEICKPSIKRILQKWCCGDVRWMNNPYTLL